MKEKVIHFLNKEIEAGSIPGCTISVSYEGENVVREALGNRAVHPTELPMQIDTLFDLASLTKVVATLPAILKLIDEGKVCLGDKVSSFIPEFSVHGKEVITLRHLLTHTSGLPAHRQFYVEQLSTSDIVERINMEKLIATPGTEVIYSDLGFILLYQIIERITGETFSTFVEREIFNPLEMLNTGFNPQYTRDSYAATEYSESLADYKYGIVHDDNTESMDGISGHAGLFSTIEDLEKFALMIENQGMYKGKRILSNRAITLSTRSQTPFDVDQRGIGWMLKSPAVLSSGDYFSDKTYGHTGFTGTSIWFDPTIKLHVILLTNRVHFGRENAITGLRARLHNLILSYY